MGMIKMFSSSSYDKTEVIYKDKIVYKNLPNPDPLNYKIIQWEKINGYLILYIEYPDCTNYEGRKILLFNKGINLKDLKKQGSIDPHFSNNKDMISPIARFEPTIKGAMMAEKLLESLK